MDNLNRIISTTDKISVDVDDFAKALDLTVVFRGNGNIRISTTNVARPGLQLAGFFEHFDSTRVQIIGNAEHEFIEVMKPEYRKERLDKFFSLSIPCLIESRSLHIHEDIMTYAQKYGCPVFLSSHVTTTLVAEVTQYLSELLAPTARVHGVLLDISGVGVLITGNAGIGKSEAALDLVSKGHRLVADDSVIVKCVDGMLVGTAPEAIKYFMEIRGLGIINIKTMFGSGAIRPSKNINIIAELVPWDATQNYERLGNEKSSVNLLGVTVQKIQIPVTPGRNIPIIVETAAKKYRLEESGYNAADELMDRAFN